ncbi:MAG: hypothetical protein ACRC3J_05545 [Culicoidibacterales bacterium]
MNPFIQAVIDNDVMAAKTAFESEMATRTAAAIEDCRAEITSAVMDGDADE